VEDTSAETLQGVVRDSLKSESWLGKRETLAFLVGGRRERCTALATLLSTRTGPSSFRSGLGISAALPALPSISTARLDSSGIARFLTVVKFSLDLANA